MTATNKDGPNRGHFSGREHVSIYLRRPVGSNSSAELDPHGKPRCLPIKSVATCPFFQLADCDRSISSTTPGWNNPPWRHNLSQMASGKPGSSCCSGGLCIGKACSRASFSLHSEADLSHISLLCRCRTSCRQARQLDVSLTDGIRSPNGPYSLSSAFTS